MPRKVKDIIKIDEAGNAGNVIYLASKSFDYFDGREWKSTSKGRGYDHIIDTIEIEKDNYTQYKCVYDNEEEYNRLQKEWLNAELKEDKYRHQELEIALKMLVDNFESLWD